MAVHRPGAACRVLCRAHRLVGAEPARPRLRWLTMTTTFDELVAESAAAPVEGWDFSWLDGRGTEQRPSWGYQRQMSRRLAGASAAADLQTGGGEVLAGAERFPPAMVATESWPPNALRATQLLHPRGVVVVAIDDHSALPFAENAFDLVTSRHPNSVCWTELARVLRPGGTYFAQHIGPASAYELAERFLGDETPTRDELHPDVQSRQAEAAGLQLLDVQTERLRMEFFDVGAVIYFLRKVIWIVPGFTVGDYLPQLRQLHDHIEREGSFVTQSTRVLIEAGNPAG